ncbi:MAG: FHA domain-containing protein [Planctomycetota bacterium]
MNTPRDEPAAIGSRTLDAAPAPVLDVTVLAGSHAATRLRFTKGPVPFGRDPSHPLLLDLATVSRDHGYFDLSDGQWVVVNRSPNGLKLGRKRVTKKPAPLPANASITIGDAALLQIELRRAGESVPSLDLDAALARKQAEPKAPKDDDPLHRHNKMPTRTRVLLGVAAFWVALFGVLLLFEPLFSEETVDARGQLVLPVARLDAAQLEAKIRRDPPNVPTDDLRAERELERAASYYALRQVNPDAPWRAMNAYRKAAGYLPDDRLADPLLQRRYLDLQQQLAEDLRRRYDDALGKLESRRFRAAAQSLDQLLRRFPDDELGEDALARHLLILREFARNHAG